MLILHEFCRQIFHQENWLTPQQFEILVQVIAPALPVIRLLGLGS